MFNISNEEFKKLKPLEDNEGAYGACYYYEDGVLKVFHEDNMNYLKPYINDILGIDIENVAFPEEIGSVGNKYAYKMKYINGILVYNIYDSVNKGICDLTFDDISKYYHNALLTVQDISDYHIMINELHVKNCKFMENNKFGIFDTDLYTKCNSEKYNIINKNNIKAVNEVFYVLLCLINSNSRLGCYFNRFIVNRDLYNTMFIDDALEELNKSRRVNTLKELIIAK